MRCEQGCRRHVLTIWRNWDTNREWQFCGIHSDFHTLALIRQGYEKVHDARR